MAVRRRGSRLREVISDEGGVSKIGVAKVQIVQEMGGRGEMREGRESVDRD
jgi:hypothetical protein